MNVGETKQALEVLQQALGSTQDLDQETEAAYLLPRIHHRRAQAHALNGELDLALRQYVSADEAFDPSNVVGRSMAKRDHGLLVWEKVDQDEGERLIREALQLLGTPSKTDPSWEEYMVTRGVLARLSVNTNPAESLAIFMQVDKQVRGGNEWVYELDNLEQIIPLVPRSQRPAYLLRASLLSTKMVAREEVARVGNELMNGDLVSAPLGCALRTANRLPRAFVTRTRAMLL